MLGSLTELVTKPKERKQLVRALVEQHYPWALALGTNATRLQLMDAFKSHGERLSANTRDKAISFYLHACEYADIEVSKFYKRKGLAATAGRRPRRAPGQRRATAEPKASTAPLTTPTATTTKATTEAEMKAAYFAMLLDKATSGEQIDDELANRMERVIGLHSAEPRRRGGRSSVKVVKALPDAVPKFAANGTDEASDDNDEATDVDPDIVHDGAEDETLEPTRKVP